MNSDRFTPPRLAAWLLNLCIDAHVRDAALGDLEEIFGNIAERKGAPSARRWYWSQTLRSLPPFLFDSLNGGFFMLTADLASTLRHLRRNKGYTLINLSGLAIGLAACLLMLLYVQDECSYDQFHEQKERIYRVGFNALQGGGWEQAATNSWAAGDLLEAHFSEIEDLVRFTAFRSAVRHGQKRFEETSMALVEDSFFEFFSFNLLQGHPAHVLVDPGSVVITEEIARKYFGDENPIGKILELEGPSGWSLTVTGVMEQMPANSHFHFDFLIGNSILEGVFSNAYFTNVGWTTQYIYVLLAKGVTADELEAKFPDFIDQHFAPTFTSNIFNLVLQPLTSIHLTSHTNDELEPNGNIRYVFIFSTVALITLLLAIINYMNLATARSSKRAKEVGVRKVLGAQRHQLIKQFLGESLLLTSFALAVACGLALLALPFFNAFTGKALHIGLFDPLMALLTFVALIVIIGVLAGSYPAFFLSSFNIRRVFEGYALGKRTNAGLRKGLVVVQFGVSIVLLVAAAIVFNQLNFMSNSDLGYDREHILFVPMQTMPRDQYPALKNEWLANPEILQVGASNIRVPGILQSTTSYQAEGVTMNPQAPLSMKQVLVDNDFFPTLDVEFVDGRNFRDFAADSSALILNEAAVRQLGWTDAVGKWFEGNSIATHAIRGTVVGVVKDFNFESLHHEVQPTVFYLYPSWMSWMYVRTTGQNLTQTLAHIEATYHKFVPDRSFTYSFLGEDVSQLYLTEEKFLQVFSIFTALAMGIACLGILGLASFSAEQRRKEVGVRKVCGASAGQIFMLFSKDFARLVLIAVIVATPVAYFIMNRWLQDFAYRVNLSPAVFLLAGLVTLLVALLTVSYQAIRAARTDPARVLRYE